MTLNHIGLPYRTLDLAKEKSSLEGLADHPLVIIAQEYLGKCLPSFDVRIVLDMVHAGAGLVNFDESLEHYHSSFREIFHFSSHPPDLITNYLKIVENSHFITFFQESENIKYLTKPVEMRNIGPKGEGIKTLLEGEGGFSAAAVTRLGAGKIVQFAVSPKIWLEQVFGHAHGLDDVFCRSIIWAARKPLVLKAMPPFVTARVDDAAGAHKFRYINVYNKYGYIPCIALFLDDVKEEDVSFMRKKQEEGMAEFAPHAFKYKRLIFFDFHKEEYSDEELEDNLIEVNAIFSSWGLKPARTIVPHYGEWGKNSVFPLLRKGHCFIATWLLPGETTLGAHRDWNPAPYGSYDFIFDHLPDYPEMYVVLAIPRDRRSKIYVPGENLFFVTRGAYKDGDFLWRRTVFRGENSFNDLEKASRAAAQHMKLGLDGLFFGCFSTHEQRISALSLDELDALLSRVEELTVKYEKICKGYDHIAQYAKNKFQSRLAEVNYNPDFDRITCTLKGKTDMPILLYVFRDEEEWVRHRFEEIPPFVGSITKTFSFRK